jgi:hypothetical protein
VTYFEKHVGDMSKLRKNIEKARDEYRSATYPGDLADELLRPTIRIGQWLSVAGMVAAAAIIVIALSLHHETPTSENPTPVIGAVATTQETGDIQLATGGVPDFATSDTSETSFAPSGFTFNVSVPSFSLAGDDESQNSSSTQPSTNQSKEQV